jgi:hypothetical protein
LRNHPFPPTAEDINRIQLQMGDHRETILEELKKREGLRRSQPADSSGIFTFF